MHNCGPISLMQRLISSCPLSSLLSHKKKGSRGPILITETREYTIRKCLVRWSNRFIGCTARGIVLSKPRIGHVNVIQFRRKELRYRVAISSTINGCCSTSLVLEKVWSDDASWPKSAPNSDTLRARLFFANRTWLLRTPNAAILAINKAIEVKMCFVPKLSLFLKYRSIIKTRCCIIVAPFSLTLNSQLSNCSLFRLANNLQKRRQIQILR